MRYCLTLVRMAIIKMSTNNKSWRRCGEKGTFLHCCWECKLVQSLWRTVWRFFRKLKIELPYDPAIPQNYNLKRHMHPYVHSSTIHNSQDTKTTYVSIDRWIDTDVAHICSRILLSLKKKQNNAIWSNVEATRDYHTNWSKLERERQIPYDIT